MALRYNINPCSRVFWLQFIAVSTLVLFAVIATASGNDSYSVPGIPKPSWWGTSESEAKPFLTLEEIAEKNEILDGRLYYTRALLTAEQFPDNKILVLLALWYAPFRERVSYGDSVAVGEYFMEKYFYWKGFSDCVSCEADMAANMVDRLVSGYCDRGNGQSALGLIDRFLEEEGSKVGFDEKAEIFDALWAMY